MYEYIIHGEVPEGAVKLPPEDIDPRKIILRDGENVARRRAEDRDAAAERCLAIYNENGGEDMVFDDPSETLRNTVWSRAKGRIAYHWRLKRAGFSRWWHWNISYHVRMWWHFRFNRERPLPGGKEALKATMLEAFRKADIQDCDLPFASDERKRDSRDKPGHWDLFFNRKRVVG